MSGCAFINERTSTEEKLSQSLLVPLWSAALVSSELELGYGNRETAPRQQV